jgi:hypothetical protein
MIRLPQPLAEFDTSMRPHKSSSCAVTDTPGSILFRTEAVRVAGGFDETLSFAEDWEMYARIACIGHFARLPVTVLDYRLHPSSAMQKIDGHKHNAALRAVFENAEIMSRFPDNIIDKYKRRRQAESVHLSIIRSRGIIKQAMNIRLMADTVAISRFDPIITMIALKGILSALKRLF